MLEKIRTVNFLILKRTLRRLCQCASSTQGSRANHAICHHADPFLQVLYVSPLYIPYLGHASTS